MHVCTSNHNKAPKSVGSASPYKFEKHFPQFHKQCGGIRYFAFPYVQLVPKRCPTKSRSRFSKVCERVAHGLKCQDKLSWKSSSRESSCSAKFGTLLPFSPTKATSMHRTATSMPCLPVVLLASPPPDLTDPESSASDTAQYAQFNSLTYLQI